MRWYLKETVHSLVADSRFSLALTYEILEIPLKAFFVLQETHCYIIISFTVTQLWKECPTNKHRRELVQSKTVSDPINLRVFHSALQTEDPNK